MHADDFVRKWSAATLSEKQAAHDHFADLCRLLDEPTPTEADPSGESYCFERRVAQAGGRAGWADVWRKDRFAWEYKSPGEDLDKAFAQLQRYAPALGNPPLLITCDLRRFRVHTNWTCVVSEVHEIAPADLLDPGKRQILKWAFSEPDRLRPTRTREALTAEAAARFAALAARLERRGHAPGEVAHFLIRLVFCMFAESVGLLRNRLFSRMLDSAAQHPDRFAARAAQLFAAMRAGGEVGFEEVQWFNGGLFDDATALPLDSADIAAVQEAATLDWSDIDPAIMGTLFERGLTPDRRDELARAIERRDAEGRSLGAVGVYYTPAAIIRRLIEPVVTRPLRRAWEEVQAEIRRNLDAERAAGSPAGRARARRRAEAAYQRHLERLRTFRVLDPACGSGNFLYLALMALKDLEHEVLVQGEAMGFGRAFALIGPEAVKGIEVNPLAVELARASVWIGEIQWRHRRGAPLPRDPVLKPLQTVEYRNALLSETGGEAPWPAADAIVGNPPFLGNKAMLRVLGEGEATRIRTVYAGRVPATADLVCYWFEKARAMIAEGTAKRAGLVATNSIRGGANRAVLDRIRDTGTIVEAWSDEPWELDGAAVRVSLVCFGPKAPDETPRLDGREVPEIFADLTGGGADLTTARRLAENRGVAFIGMQQNGPFTVPGDLARVWLEMPANPNLSRNQEVVRPWVNGQDLTKRPTDRWIIDFGCGTAKSEAALYEAPFEYAIRIVKPFRDHVQRRARRENWWRLGEPMPALRLALAPLRRYLATPRVAKHRVFVWIVTSVVADCAVSVITRDDDTTFGILHSRFHELWSLRLGTSLEDRPRYTPSTTFETFPFPDGLTPDRPASTYADDPRAQAIADAARRLDELRAAWLNPADLVERVPEVVPGFPDRIVPRDAKAAAALKARTLTNLYNAMPDWLRTAHADLDAAVAAAYGWPADLPDEEVLRRLLALNHARAASRRPAAKRRFHWSDPRQIALPFPMQQLALRLPDGTGAAPEKRPKRPRRRAEPERRQRHLPLVIPGGLRARVHAAIAARAEAA